ncbi:protein-serine/threonine kinase [Geosmithia morbida]|uniref:non-specific serine/threonine protein kinase n=1 Tax=Geosmithia morbida TaxID=1094350 RepID=A0A9P4YW04_9HYPO|nr:protein-serine/threonine kinase [Geosmithia morbida]KAF4124131.1 protein-serine/threonine kinase [Geosmithia morbida]
MAGPTGDDANPAIDQISQPDTISPRVTIENHDGTFDNSHLDLSSDRSNPTHPGQQQYASPTRQHKRTPSAHREIKAVKEFSKTRLRKRAQSNILRQGPHRAKRFSGPNGPFSSPYDVRAVENNDALYLIREEVAIMKKLNHPNLVSLIEVLDNPEEDSLYMVLEMCKKGVVMKVGLDEDVTPYSEETCRYWFRDLILGIEYLHAQGVIHRDIKPDNLLLSEDNVLKVVDFGVSQMFEKKSEMKTNKSAGSPAFLPPELCGKHGEVSGAAADIWSMGVSLFCLRYGRIPFNRDSIMKMYEAIKSDEPTIPADENPTLKDLFSKILEKDPEKRIQMPQLREHPWVTKEGTDPLLSEKENCAHHIEPPNELEISRAFTRKMNHLLYVMKVLYKFKSLLAKKSRDQSTGDKRPSSLRATTTTQGTGTEEPGFDPIEEKAKAEEIEALLEARRAFLCRSQGADGRQCAILNDSGQESGDQENPTLFLGIGTGANSNFFDGDASPNVVADSPTAVEFDVYDRAYEDAVRKLESSQEGKPTVYRTRFVEYKNDSGELEEQYNTTLPTSAMITTYESIHPYMPSLLLFPYAPVSSLQSAVSAVRYLYVMARKTRGEEEEEEEEGKATTRTLRHCTPAPALVIQTIPPPSLTLFLLFFIRRIVSSLPTHSAVAGTMPATNLDASRKSTSAPSSKPSSLKSADGLVKPPPKPQKSPDPSIDESTNAFNGDSLLRPAAADKSEKTTTVKERFSRIFSTKEVPKAPSSASSASGEPNGRARGSSLNNGTSTPMSRNESASDQGKPTKPSPTKESFQRFVVNPSLVGGHEHHLKSSRRQEKLSDMWRTLIGGKRQDLPDSDLSLVNNWVDALRQEKDEAGDRRGGPNNTPTLVEKYGKCHEVVGRGAFGIVRISHKKIGGSTEKLYAVKEFRRRPEETEKKYSKRLTAEFCISSSLRHPNVIHTLDLVKDAKGDYCEVMEFCAGGDLYTLVLSSGRLDIQEADCFFKQMMRGVQYLHEMGVAHRDLKPENLLLTTRGGLKITDFGNGECFRMAWEADAHMVSGLCGSAPYISPEEYTDKEFDARAVDVWACGVIYMAMRTGRHLWRLAKKDEDEFYARYLEGRRDEGGYGPIESLTRARCRNVIYSVLDPNPTRRLTAAQVLKSEWARDITLCKAGEEGL